VFLLNNDAILKEDSLAKIVAFCENRPDVGICGVQLVDMVFPHAIQAFGGGRVNFLGVTKHITDKKDVSNLDYITGAAMLVKKEVIEDIGSMDENFFMYWEDVDYSYRARLAGWKLDCCVDSVVYHKESASSGKRSSKQIKMKNKSAKLFASKFCGRLKILFYIGMYARYAKAKLAHL